MNYKIFPPNGILEAVIAMPLSKSISNRSLIINALTANPTTIGRMASCSDTTVMQNALSNQSATEINVKDAGTAMRFLTAYFASQPGRTVTLSGNERMHQRPIGQLVDALRKCGADITYTGIENFPPLTIRGRKLSGGRLEIDATVSSQFVSALLMIAPAMRDGLELTLNGDAVSLPYIDLTLDLMQKSGIKCDRTGQTITVAPGEYLPTPIRQEGDWSAAAFWYEIVALTGGFLTLSGLDLQSKQPDRRTVDLFCQLGAVTNQSEESDELELSGSPDVAPRMNADLSSTPDLVPAVAVTCAMIGVPFRLSGLTTLKIKETDRLEALATELLKIGIKTDILGNDTLEWDGRRQPIFEIPEFDTYSDHRMAMSLAPIAVYIPGIIIRDVDVVAKSYPGYWDDLRAAGFEIVNADDNSDQTDHE